LVFDVGILYLALTSGLLLTVFGGITERLIPLFAVGAFLTFTISQTGMVWHWRRIIAETDAPKGKLKTHLLINCAGAITTGAALVIIIAAKLIEGAWITILVLPLAIIMLKTIKAYYDLLDAQLRGRKAARSCGLEPSHRPRCI
jgi:hypothetical protein